MSWRAVPVVAVVAGLAVGLAFHRWETSGWDVLLRIVIFVSLVAPTALTAARFRMWQAALIALAPGLVVFGIGLLEVGTPDGTQRAGNTEDWTKAGALILAGILISFAALVGSAVAVGISSFAAGVQRHSEPPTTRR